MQALILATDEAPQAGAEPKLHPLTERIPAPLLPVLNRPIMAYPLELLARAGLRDIGVAVYNKAGAIEAHFGAGTGHAAQLTYFLQREPLGSAGSLRWAATGLKEAFVALPGDAIVDFDLCAALEFHRAHGGIATVIAHAPRQGYPLHPVAVASDGRVTALWGETGAQDALANTGAYIFEPRIFDCISSLQRQRPRQTLDCYADLLPRLLDSEDVYAYAAEGYWNPIHNVPAYHQAQLDALASAVGAAEQTDLAAEGAPAVRFVSAQERELAPGVLAGRHATIHPSARLVAPVYIGAGSQIERDAELGPGVIIGANAIIDASATVRNSSVLKGTYVGQLVKVDGRVVRGGLVIDAASGDSLRVVDRFLLGEVSPRLFAGLFSRLADVGGALLLLLLALPALALIALLLLLTSLLTGKPGRVLELRPRVRWQRAGEADAPEKQAYAALHFPTRREDGAHVPLGAFLERTQLDRLPALVSVLKGELRLVGVKPLHPSEADHLVEEWQRLPYEGRAGFTGLWYVQGGGADLNDLDEIVATDAYYSATRSFLGDARLLLLTPVAWARGWAGADSNRHNSPRPAPRRSRMERRVRALPPSPKDAAAKQAGE